MEPIFVIFGGSVPAKVQSPFRGKAHSVSISVGAIIHIGLVVRAEAKIITMQWAMGLFVQNASGHARVHLVVKEQVGDGIVWGLRHDGECPNGNPPNSN